jgi:hypothetical protein
MKLLPYSICVTGILLLAAFAPPRKQRKITLPLENHVGNIQWIKLKSYNAVKNSRGSIEKGMPACSPETWTYDEYGDEIEDEKYWYDTSSTPYNKCTYEYYPNGDIKERTIDSTINVRIGPIPEHYAGWHGTDGGTQFKRVNTTFDFKYINRYDARGNLLSSTGNYRLTYGATSCKFFYDAAGNLQQEFLFCIDTIHPQDAFYFWYNATGQVTKEILARRTRLPDYTIDLQPETKTEYYRNDKGMVVYKATYRFQAAMTQDEKITYDDAGDTLEIVRTDYLYDGRTNTNPVWGRLVKEFLIKQGLLYEDVYGSDGKLSDYTLSQFDSENHVLDKKQFHTNYHGTGPADTIMVHHLVYDNHFNVIEDDAYDNAGKVQYENKWQYKYDSVGNWVERLFINDGKPDVITEREIHYFTHSH